jgi:hypothetical protein
VSNTGTTRQPVGGGQPVAAQPGAALYLDLMRRSLLGLIEEDPPIPTPWQPATGFDRRARLEGRDWPSAARTMIGLRRLTNIQLLVERIIADGVPGDLLEAGVARGGAAMFMRAVLRACGCRDRVVWVADSFAGFPSSPRDAGQDSPLLRQVNALRDGDPGPAAPMYQQFLHGTSLPEVRASFERYGLLDEQVRFLPGWFADTLPGPVGRLALLRLDADLYGSTYDALRALYPRVAPGGYVVVDDYRVIEECRRAVQDYLAGTGAAPDLVEIDYSAVFWRKAG